MTLILLRTELLRLFATPLAWVMLGIAQLIQAWAYFSELERYNELQARLIASESPLGLTSLVLVPSLLNGLNLLLVMTPLLTMRSFASERQSQRFDLLLASPASPTQILWSRFLALFLLLGLFWILGLLQLAALMPFAAPDFGMLLVTWLAGLLVIGSYISAGLWLSSLTRLPVLAALSTYGLLLMLRLVGQDSDTSLLQWLSMNKHLEAARMGLFDSTDLIYFILLISLFLVLAWTRLLNLRSLQQRGATRVTVVLLLLAFALVWPVLEKNRLTMDFSHGAQNTLSPASQAILRDLDDSLSFTVYVGNSPVLKKQLLQLLARFERHRPGLPIQVIDPQQQPEAARVLGITRNGEILVRYQGRQQLVKLIDEAHISQTILHLSQRDQGWLLNLQGHGEVSLLDSGLYGAGTLARNLRARGYLLRDFNLHEQGLLPDNTELVIVGGATTPLSAGTEQALNRYLDTGGDLLWLTDPETNTSLSTLLALPTVDRLPGVIVDATAAQLKLSSPDNAVVTSYPDHDISRQLTRHTLFPQAAGLMVRAEAPWQQVATLSTGSLSWNETGSLKGEIDRDPVMFEQQGPLTVGVLLKRPVGDGWQKIALFGDSDFLRNQILGQGDNLQLVLNLFYWFSNDQTGFDASTLPVTDQRLDISDTAKAIYGLVFLILFPGLLLASGLLIPWWRKRRQ